MEMMYAYIVQSMCAKQIYDENLKGYLTFFCLENIEVKEKGEYMPKEVLDEDYDYKRAQ